MALDAARFVNLVIYEIAITLPKPGRPYFVLQHKSQKFSSTAPEVKTSQITLSKQRFVISLTENEAEVEHVVLSVYDKGAKFLGGNASYGEVTIPVKELLRRHARKDKDSADVSGEIYIIDKKEKAKVEVTIFAEAYGPQHWVALTKNEDTRNTALLDIKQMTVRAKKRDLRQSLEVGDTKAVTYMQESVLFTLVKLLKKSSSSKREGAKETRKIILDAFGALCEDNRVRQKMVELNFLEVVSEFINKKDPELQIAFLNCLKHFFTSAANQRFIIKTRVMDNLIELLNPKTDMSVLGRVFEVLRYFDPKHIEQMIERDILVMLKDLLSMDNAIANVQILEMVKYFGIAYRETLIEAKMAKPIRKLIQSTDTQVKLKAIDVYEKFKFPTEDDFDVQNVASLVESFKPDDNANTKLKLLSKIGEAIAKDDDAERAIMSKTSALNMLVRALNDSSSVVQDRTHELLFSLKNTPDSDLVEAKALKALSDTVKNKKLPSTAHTRAFKQMMRFITDFQQQMDAEDIPALSVLVMNDAAYNFDVRQTAVDVIEKFQDATFTGLISSGALDDLQKLIAETALANADTAETVALTIRCLLWIVRYLELNKEAVESLGDAMLKMLESIDTMTNQNKEVEKWSAHMDSFIRFCRFPFIKDTQAIHAKCASILAHVSNFAWTSTYPPSQEIVELLLDFLDKYQGVNEIALNCIKGLCSLSRWPEGVSLITNATSTFPRLISLLKHVSGTKNLQETARQLVITLRNILRDGNVEVFARDGGISPLLLVFTTFSGIQNVIEEAHMVLSELSKNEEIAKELAKENIIPALISSLSLSFSANQCQSITSIILKLLQSDTSDKLCKDFIKANGPSIFIQRAVQYAYDRTFQETARTFIMFIADFDITVLIATGVQFSSLMVNVLLTNANNSNVKPVLSVIRKALDHANMRKDYNFHHNFVNRLNTLFSSAGYDAEYAWLAADCLRVLWQDDRAKQDLCAIAQTFLTTVVSRFAPRLPSCTADSWKQVRQKKRKAFEDATAAALSSPNKSPANLNEESNIVRDDKPEESEENGADDEKSTKDDENVNAEERKQDENVNSEEIKQDESESDDDPSEKKEIPSDVALEPVEVTVAPVSPPANSSESTGNDQNLLMSLITTQVDLDSLLDSLDPPPVENPRHYAKSLRTSTRHVPVSKSAKRRNSTSSSSSRSWESETESSSSSDEVPVSPPFAGQKKKFTLAFARSKTTEKLGQVEIEMAKVKVNAIPGDFPTLHDEAAVMVVENALTALYILFEPPAIMQPYLKNNILNGLRAHMSTIFGSTPAVVTAACSLLSVVMPVCNPNEIQRDITPNIADVPEKLLSNMDPEIDPIGAIKTANLIFLLNSPVHITRLIEEHKIVDSLGKIVDQALAESAIWSSPSSVLASAFGVMTKLFVRKPTELSEMFASAVPRAVKRFPNDTNIKKTCLEVLSVLASSTTGRDRFFQKDLIDMFMELSKSVTLTTPVQIKIMSIFKGLGSRLTAVSNVEGLMLFLLNKIEARIDYQITRDAAQTLGAFVPKNKKYVAFILSKGIINTCKTLAYAAQHYYLLPMIWTLCKSSEQFRDEFYSDIKKTIETTAYTNVNLLNLYTRVLCILIATTDFDGQAALIKNGLIDLLYKVLGGPAGGTSSVTSAIDCLEAVFLIEKHLRTSHKDFLKNFRSKCDQAKTQYRYNSYAFYFDLFQSGLQDNPPGPKPSTSIFMAHNNGFSLIASDALTIGCNQPVLASLRTNKPIRAGKFFFEVVARMVPLWSSLSVGLVTEKGFTKLNAEERRGVGQAKGTWGINFSSRTKYENGLATPIASGFAFNTNATVTCLYDASLKQATFLVNGISTNVSLDGIDADAGVYPCITLDTDALVKLNFESTNYVRDSSYLQMEGLIP